MGSRLSMARSRQKQLSEGSVPEHQVQTIHFDASRRVIRMASTAMLPPVLKAHVTAAITGADEGVRSIVATDLGLLITLIALGFLAIAVLRAVVGIVSFIFIYFLRPAKNLKFYGSWAVVTGATDGIGKAYAVELAKRGLNLVIVSRTQSKLDNLAAELRTAYKVEVATVAADLCKLDAPTAGRLAGALKGLDVGILVNNAGMSYDHAEYLEQMDSTADIDMITINTLAPTLLSKMVLPGMKDRRRGVIINLGSANGLLPAVPLLATYAGTKAYINQFTRSLDAEARPFGVRVHDQCPMFVATKMAKIRRARLDAPTPAVWAKAAVKQIGYDTVRTPYWYHGLMMAVINNLAPRGVIVSYVHKLHQGFRKAYYKKKAKAEMEAAGQAVADLDAKKAK